MSMRPEIKTKWVEALRSGAYSQGSGKLAGSVVGNPEDGKPSYCCLGVLCDLAVKEGVIPEPVVQYRMQPWSDQRAPGYYLKFAGEGGYLPDDVREWAGLEYYNPSIGHKGYPQKNASNWNDSGTPFAEIAHMIEESL